MSTTREHSCKPLVQLLTGPLAPYVGIYEGYLSDRGYAPSTKGRHFGCLAHFGRWMGQCRLDAEDIDEEVVAQFLDDHLPHCQCRAPVVRSRVDLRAALGHLLVVLRANAVIPERVLETTPVDEELRRFDAHMERVRGLAAKTRRSQLRIVRCFLLQQFGDGPLDLSAIKPEAIRRFLTEQSVHYSSSGSITTLVSALRAYFRFRTACGDQAQALTAVLTSPRHWQHASLPKALSSVEVECLVNSLGWEGPSARRAAAMVRLALDLGLRRAEIANLALDDIDWRAGTIRLRQTKGGREDMLPLPETTGRAIADYLRLERPETTSRAVFVRHIAPYGRPIGPDCVGKTFRQAYARAGLPYTRAHLLRHSTAMHMLESGVHFNTIALYLGHETPATTHRYVEANLAMKEQALARLEEPPAAVPRYRPPDELRRFLEDL